MKVTLTVYAEGLENIQGSPFAVVTHVASVPGQRANVLGKTETLSESTPDPRWTKEFSFNYEFGKPMRVAISVFDNVAKGKNTPMGVGVFDVGELLNSQGVQAKKLRKGGKLFAQIKQAPGQGTLKLRLRGSDLKKSKGFGLLARNDPFFEVYASSGKDKWDKVFRSDIVRKTTNPKWKEGTIEISALCDGDLNKSVKIAVFDYESNGRHKDMGMFVSSVNKLVHACKEKIEIPIKQDNEEVGKISIVQADVDGYVKTQASIVPATSPITQASQPSTGSTPAKEEAVEEEPTPAAAPAEPTVPRPTFVNYIRGGCEIDVVVAIDYSGSNGNPREQGTLHYIDTSGGTQNDYQKSIGSVAKALTFGQERTFTVYGFGAKIDGELSHCFECASSAEVKGIDGVLDAYRNVFRRGLTMSSPTRFEEVITAAADRASSKFEAAQSGGKQSYTVLVILTDGGVTDKDETAAVLKRLADKPLSVVIVGIGGDDFESMSFLDALDEDGSRDITNFVEFSMYKDNQFELTAATLKEVPKQLVGYYKSKGIDPMPPKAIEVQVEDEEDIELGLDINEDGTVNITSE